MKEVAANPAGSPPPSKKKRILVVEDESTTRLFLLNQLKKAGLEVDAAANGNIGLRKVKDAHFDALILDLMLPGIKGEDFIKEVRKKESLANIPIFVITSAQRMDPWRKRGAKAGATKVFDKASPIETIVAEIANHLIPKAPAAEPSTPATADANTRPVPAKASEISPRVPRATAPVPAATPVNLTAAPAKEGPLFTPLPSGQIGRAH